MKVLANRKEGSKVESLRNGQQIADTRKDAKKDVEQNCLGEKTKRTKTYDFLITKCQFLDILTTVYIVL